MWTRDSDVKNNWSIALNGIEDFNRFYPFYIESGPVEREFLTCGTIKCVIKVLRQFNFCFFTQKLMDDRIILQKRRDNFKKMIQALTVRYESLKSQLNDNETYSQVGETISQLSISLTCHAQITAQCGIS